MLPQDEKNQDRRREMDNTLAVREWRVPGTTPKPVKPRPEGAPSWWVDDEEASQGFLAMVKARPNA